MIIIHITFLCTGKRAFSKYLEESSDRYIGDDEVRHAPAETVEGHATIANLPDGILAT